MKSVWWPNDIGRPYVISYFLNSYMSFSPHFYVSEIGIHLISVYCGGDFFFLYKKIFFSGAT